LAFASPSLANTYIVDVAGGGQFTNIQPAITFAQPGDVLLVMPGVYHGGFTLTKGLTIVGIGVGFGNVRIVGDANVISVHNGETAALVGLGPINLTIASCSGSVLAQEFCLPLAHVSISHSRDVRLRRDVVLVPNGQAMNGIDVTTARVELVRCTPNGSDGQDCLTGVGGGVGIQLGGGSRVQLALSTVTGGDGASCLNFPTFQGGDGNAAIALGALDTLYLTGGGVSVITGGAEGQNTGLLECTHNGVSGPAISLGGGTLQYSGVTLVGPRTRSGLDCVSMPGVMIAPPGQATPITPDDPTLDIEGVPVAGGQSLFTLRAPPGSSAILYFGRTPVLIHDPNTEIEQMTEKSRIVNLGTIPASGQATFVWPIDASSAPGAMWVAQAEVTVAAGDVRHTNSIPVIVR
jgi:hypothetical protein